VLQFCVTLATYKFSESIIRHVHWRTGKTIHVFQKFFRSKLKKTPNVMSPLAMPLNRPRTRSMSNTTLTPQAAALATTDPVTPITKPLKRSSTSTPVVEVTRKVTNSLIPDHSTPAVTRSQIQKSMEAAKPVSPVTQAQLDRSPTKSLKRKSTSHESLPGASPPKRAPVRPPMAPAGRTALRTRIDSAKPLRARTSSSSGPVRQSRSPVKGLRQRTNSSNGQTSLRQRTSSSDSSSSLSRCVIICPIEKEVCG